MKKLIILGLALGLVACSTPNEAESENSNTNSGSTTETSAEASGSVTLESAKTSLKCMQDAGDTNYSSGLAGQIELQEKLPSENTLAAMKTQIDLYNAANDPDC